MDDWCSNCGAQGVELYDCGVCGGKYCEECYDVHINTTHLDYDGWEAEDYDEETEGAMRGNCDEPQG